MVSRSQLLIGGLKISERAATALKIECHEANADDKGLRLDWFRGRQECYDYSFGQSR